MISGAQHSPWLLAFAALVSGNYTSSQVGTWDRPRAAIIRDHVYLEGGKLQTGTWNETEGTWDNIQTMTVSNGVLFNLNLHQPFNVSDPKAPALFVSMDETQVNNYFVDGAMFADYNEFYAWG